MVGSHGRRHAVHAACPTNRLEKLREADGASPRPPPAYPGAYPICNVPFVQGSLDKVTSPGAKMTKVATRPRAGVGRSVGNWTDFGQTGTPHGIGG